MRIYVLENDACALDAALAETLETLPHETARLTLPADHGALPALLADRQPGIALLPAAWDDLFCVKCAGEIADMAAPFVAVLAGPEPPVSHLVAAFNSGLAAYMTTPADAAAVERVLRRAQQRLEQAQAAALARQELSYYQAGGVQYGFTQEAQARNQLLGQAMMHCVDEEGPFHRGEVEVLLVASSPSQQKQMAGMLRKIGASVTCAANAAEALKEARQHPFALVISDNVLPDGSGQALCEQLRAELKTVPYFMVWSASPDKASELLRPETHVNDVIIKPGPEQGIESALPTIVAAIYRTIAARAMS